MSSKILPQYREILERETGDFIVYSDVHGAPTDPRHRIDPDAERTTDARSILPRSFHHHYALTNVFEGAYFADLESELLVHKRREVTAWTERLTQAHKPVHPDLRKLEQLLKTTTNHVVVNTAPRDSTVKGNGREFHAAITKEGLVVWSVPLEALTILATRDRIVALYKVPNSGHDVFSDEEQFRSSVVSTFRFDPDLLKPVFQKGNEHDQAGYDVIESLKTRGDRVAYIDRFGNVRIFSSGINLTNIQPDGEETNHGLNFDQLTEGEKIPLSITGQRAVFARKVTSLVSIPDSELGLYHNPADPKRLWHEAGYLELVRRTVEPTEPQVVSADRILTILHPGGRHSIEPGLHIKRAPNGSDTLSVSDLDKLFSDAWIHMLDVKENCCGHCQSFLASRNAGFFG